MTIEIKDVEIFDVMLQIFHRHIKKSFISVDEIDTYNRCVEEFFNISNQFSKQMEDKSNVQR